MISVSANHWCKLSDDVLCLYAYKRGAAMAEKDHIHDNITADRLAEALEQIQQQLAEGSALSRAARAVSGHAPRGQARPRRRK